MSTEHDLDAVVACLQQSIDRACGTDLSAAQHILWASALAARATHCDGGDHVASLGTDTDQLHLQVVDLQNALNIQLQWQGQQHPGTWPVMRRLTQVLQAQHCYREALELTQAELQARAAVQGLWHPALVPLHLKLANLLHKCSNASEAMQKLDSAVSAYQLSPFVKATALSDLLMLQAAMSDATGQLEQA